MYISYMNVRTRILSVFCAQVVSQSYSYGYVHQVAVAVTDENNIFVIQQKSKGSLDNAAWTFTDNTDVLGSTA
jgi:hypothetical protein